MTTRFGQSFSEFVDRVIIAASKIKPITDEQRRILTESDEQEICGKQKSKTNQSVETKTP